jgi:hypothetical protein
LTVTVIHLAGGRPSEPCLVREILVNQRGERRDIDASTASTSNRDPDETVRS